MSSNSKQLFEGVPRPVLYRYGGDGNQLFFNFFKKDFIILLSLLYKINKYGKMSRPHPKTARGLRR